MGPPFMATYPPVAHYCLAAVLRVQVPHANLFILGAADQLVAAAHKGKISNLRAEECGGSAGGQGGARGLQEQEVRRKWKQRVVAV